MKLIIDIPEEDYIRLRDEGMFGNVTTFKRAVREGIPLEQEPCENVISRQAVLEKAIHVPIARVVTEDKVIYRKIVFADEIENLPPVTPAEKVGHWIMHIDDLFPAESTMECNKCHEHQPITIDDNYCPSCGAKMQEVEE